MSLVLASASPRRAELLQRAGIPFEIRPAEIDETPFANESALDYVGRICGAKADAVSADTADWVLGADTIVVVDGAILGKAQDRKEAAEMLRRLRGRWHRVSTGYAIRGSEKVDRVVTTEVEFRDFGDDEVASYVAATEWQGKAGAYAIQGMAAAFVSQVRGCVTNVIGLPLASVVTDLAALGIANPDYSAGGQ